ncbi:MAG TPA: GNAT family N-acetyltransferase [Roseiflexaceae bacterium]|nr:GNAT family N-acetyltransferase [Roseiflexaceae bacterium]
MQIELLPAAAGDRTTLANLLQLYLYDLLDFGGQLPDERGAFSYPDLDRYWSDPDCHPFLIRADGVLAGFALVHRASRIHNPFDGHAIADFFVLRGCRRQGVGGAAAMQLFDRFPGRWEICTAAANVPATAFWRSVSQRYTCGTYEEVFVTRDGWRGVIESFVAPPPCRGRE